MSERDLAPWRRNAREHLVDHSLGGDSLGLSRKRRKNAVPQHRPRDATDVVRRHRRAPRQQRVRLGAKDERLPRTRSGAPSNGALHEIGGGRIIRTRRASERGSVAQRRLGGRYLTHQPLHGDRSLTIEHGRQRRWSGAGSRAQNGNLVLLPWIADADVEQKAIELRLGKWICPFLLDGILRRQDEKWLGQAHRLTGRR